MFINRVFLSSLILPTSLPPYIFNSYKLKTKKSFLFIQVFCLKAACLQKSTRCLKIARLAELQIRYLSQGKQIIGLEKYNLSKILCTHQDFYEVRLFNLTQSIL